MIEKGSIRSRLLIGMASLAVLVAACSSSGASTAPSAAAPSAAAPSAAAAASAAAPSGGAAQAVHDRLLEHRRHGQRLPRGADLHRQGRSALVGPGRRRHHHPPQHGCGRQLQDIRDLIAKGVDAIVFNPNDPAALNPALAEAKAAGIKTVVGRRLRHRPGHLQPVQQPGSSTPSSAPSGCSRSSAARAPSTTCAASPATRPTPTATSASRTRSRATRTSRSSRAPTASPPAGIRRPPPSWPTSSSPAASTTASRASGPPASTRRSLTPSRPPARTFVPIVGTDRGSFVKQLARPDRLSRPRGRRGHQHRRRRRRRRQPGAQAPQRRDHHDRRRRHSRTPSC